jgi:hypothetical protein
MGCSVLAALRQYSHPQSVPPGSWNTVDFRTGMSSNFSGTNQS